MSLVNIKKSYYKNYKINKLKINNQDEMNEFKGMSEEQKKYLVKNVNKHLCNTDKKVLFDNIGEFEYNKVAELMYKEFKSEHFQKLLDLKIDSNKIYSDSIDKVRYYDELISYYLQCREKCSIITCWDRVKSIDLEVLLKFLKQNGNVYYVRRFNFNEIEQMSLIYQLYIDSNRLSTIESIKEKVKYTTQSGIGGIVHVIVFDNVKKLDIAGGQSKFKTEIRNILVNRYNNKFRGDDFIHINDHFCQAIEYAQIYFNKYSRRQLGNFNIERFLSKDFNRSKVIFLTFKNWLSINTTLLQRMKFCLMSGSTLFSHGIRKTNDIDAIYIDGDIELDKKVKYFFFDENTKFSFSDVGSENWKDTWKDSNKKWLNLLGINSINDLILNPRYHYYFLGVKIFRIDLELFRKIKIVNSPKTLADIFYINKNSKIEISEFESNNKVEDHLNKNDKKYREKYNFFLKKNYGYEKKLFK